MTDRELLAAYSASGSPEAFARIVDRHAGLVYATCLRMVGEAHAAEDAAQATFLVFFRKARALPRGTVLSGWLFRTAECVARDARKLAARRRRHESEAASMRNSTAEGRPAPGLALGLDAALAALPEVQRDAIVLRYLRGLPEAEVCRELGCPQSTLATRISRGLEKLRSLLARQGVAVPAAALGGLLAAQAGSATVPAALLATLKGIGAGAAAASVSATALAEGTMKAMMIAKVKLAAAVVGAVLAVGGGGGAVAVKLAAGEPANPPTMAEPGKAQALPSWVPAPGSIAILTKGAGVLVNNYRDVVASYYEPFYAVKNINDYSGAVVNPYWGAYGALIGFGGGHASTNDNSVWTLELSAKAMRFRRLVDPTPFFGTGVDAATKARNAGNHDDWRTGYQVQTDPDYGEVFVKDVHQVGVPASCHSYDALDVIGPENGGAACGSFILVARSELNYGGGKHALAAHVVDFKQDTGADGSYRWRRFADAHDKLGGVPNVVTAKVSRQNRIYWMGSKAGGAPRWFDLATKTYGSRAANGALINEGGSNTESMTYVKERDLLLFAGQSGGNLRIQYLTVAPGDNSSGWAVAKLDKPLPIAGNPSHIAWCPDNNRLIVGAIEGDDNCVYEIQVSDSPVAPWVCTRVPFPAGQSIPWARRDTWPKGWEYNPKVKAIVYISGVRIDGGNDSVYVYRPHGT